MAKHTFHRKDIILFLLLAATLHILSTYLVTVRVRHLMNTQVADTSSGPLLDQFIPKKDERYISKQSTEELKKYRYILFFLSLPFEPVFRPVHEVWANRPFLENRIEKEEYELRIKFIGIVARVLNSLAFSLLTYWILLIAVRQHKKTEYRSGSR